MAAWRRASKKINGGETFIENNLAIEKRVEGQAIMTSKKK